MRELAALEVRELVAGSFLDQAPIVPVSARSGEGLDALRGVLADLVAAARPRDAGGAVRLAVDRTFSMRGFGTVATGTLVSGTLGVDDEVQVLPGATLAKVRGLHVHGQARSTAVAGERVAVNLSGLEVADVPRGSVLATPSAYLPTRRADVELTLLPGVPPLKHGARLRLHHGTAELLARVSLSPAPRGSWPLERRRRPACGSKARPFSLAGIGSSCAPIRRWRRSAAAWCSIPIRRGSGSARRVARRASRPCGGTRLPTATCAPHCGS